MTVDDNDVHIQHAIYKRLEDPASPFARFATARSNGCDGRTDVRRLMATGVNDGSLRLAIAWRSARPPGTHDQRAPDQRGAGRVGLLSATRTPRGGGTCVRAPEAAPIARGAQQ